MWRRLQSLIEAYKLRCKCCKHKVKIENIQTAICMLLALSLISSSNFLILRLPNTKDGKCRIF
jgi:hypothetical protein